MSFLSSESLNNWEHQSTGLMGNSLSDRRVMDEDEEDEEDERGEEKRA